MGGPSMAPKSNLPQIPVSPITENLKAFFFTKVEKRFMDNSVFIKGGVAKASIEHQKNFDLDEVKTLFGKVEKVVEKKEEKVSKEPVIPMASILEAKVNQNICNNFLINFRSIGNWIVKKKGDYLKSSNQRFIFECQSRC
jgi:hypothetical protein